MNRFMITFEDGRPPVGLNTMHQVKTYLERAVPDATTAVIYEQTAEAIRDQWKITEKKKKSTDSSRHLQWTRWTPEDDCTCLKMKKAGAPVQEIADVLNRSVNAVYARIAKYKTPCP